MIPGIVLLGLLGACTAPQPESSDEAKARYETLYTRPLISPGAKFSQLPPTVQNTIRAQTGGAELADIAKGSGSGKVVYIVYFQNPKLLPPLYVAADGSVLYPDLTIARAASRDSWGALPGSTKVGLTPGDLPPEVQHRVPAQQTIRSISKEVWGSRTVYVLSFEDEAHHPKLYIAEDGTVLKGGTP